MNRLLHISCSCALALSGIASAESQTPAADASAAAAPAIKLKWADGMMTLPVEINDQKGCLMVDTGAMTTSLRDSAAKDLNITLKEADGMSGTGVAGDFGKVMTGTAPIKVPGQKPDAFPKLAGPHAFIPIASADQSGVFGVIGMDDLSAAGAVIHSVNGSMQLHPEGDFHAPKGYLELPMTRLVVSGSAKENSEFLWALPVKIHGTDGWMVVDTAAQATLLDEEFAKQAGIELAKSDVIATGAGTDSQELTTATTPDLILGGKVDLGAVRVNGSDLKNISSRAKPADGSTVPFAGILGMDQLSRVQAILDCKRGIFHSASKAITANIDPALIIQVLSALVAKGDDQAIQLQERAVKNNGNLAIDPLQASQLIIRARSQGLIDDSALDPKKQGAISELITAIQKLAAAGDEEAKQCITEAAANKGALKLAKEKADQLVARAREKGLLEPHPNRE